MSTPSLTVLMRGLTFPEGPRWREGRLWFSDFYSHRVLAVDLHGRSETVAEVPQQPSGLGWTPVGDLLMVSMLDRRLLRLRGGTLTQVADLSALATGPCNDMVVDSAGRAYVGNFGFDHHHGEAERTACLVRVDPDGSITRAAEDLRFPNGTVISPDGRTMIVAETRGHRLTAFTVAADGTLSGRRLFADLGSVWPDGICLDREGAVWVTDARGPLVLRVADGGTVLQSISMGDRRAFACMLGGEDRRTLFLCTCTASGPAVAVHKQGAIEFTRVEIPGAGLP